MHVTIHVTSLPVEIQVRTELQDIWAQIVERLGDRWGRELRYGEPIVDGDEPIVSGISVSRSQLLANVMTASDMIDTVERARAGGYGDEITVRPSPDHPEHEEATVSLSQIEVSLSEYLDDLKSSLRAWLELEEVEPRMNHYLIVFDRTQGTVLSLERCASPGEAMRVRFAAEREHQHRSDIEVVVLGAQSEKALRSTHSRYFDSVKELIGRGSRLVRSPTPA